MSDEIPLGKREDLHLELKSADALKDPEKIAREVVAMLNAEGGEVWVGLREEEERAVLVESIPDAERESRRLHDYLVDVIEPPPDAREVSVILRESDDGGRLLCIETAPSSDRKPYAFLKKGGRYYVTRVGARIRPMTREEVLARPLRLADTDLERAESKMFAERKQILEDGGTLLWLRLQPERSVSVDIHASETVDLLQNPRRTGNRSTGSSFASFWHRPKVEEDRVKTHPHDVRSAEIRDDGGLVFAAPLQVLAWRNEPGIIRPLVLLEYVVSGFRIARTIYRQLGPNDRVLADLVLLGVKGWSTEETSSQADRRPVLTGKRDFILVQPLTFQFKEIHAEPDRCGHRLVERAFDFLGLAKNQRPSEFDPREGRLVLPE